MMTKILQMYFKFQKSIYIIFEPIDILNTQQTLRDGN